MAYDFTPPEFFDDCDADTIQQRMMANLPPDIDDMPGGFPYDFTAPAALEKSELIQYHMTRVLMLMFPQFAWGSWLDYHAAQVGISRRAAICATGSLRVEGETGTAIPQGTIFCTAATEDNSSVLFSADEEAVISDGYADIPVTAVEAGKEGNVIAGTIVLAQIPIRGITKITNPETISNGADEEDDETLRERIMAESASEITNVGNNADYVRWAKEVQNVGSVAVIPEWNGPGTVKLIIVDSNGQPASEEICRAVYEHIMSPDAPMERKAPIGARLTVSAPDVLDLSYKCTILGTSGMTADIIKAAFAKNLSAYYPQAQEDGVVKYAKITSLLITTDGVKDITELTVNGAAENIPVTQSQFPVTKEINITLEEG